MDTSSPWSLVLLIPLVAASAICSCSETVLFGFSASERSHLRRVGGVSASAVEILLRRPGELLVTVLTANMTVNTLYFAIASVFLLEADVSGAQRTALAVGQFIVLILMGEVVPKMIGNSARVPCAIVLAPVMLVVHWVALPIRLVIEFTILRPLRMLIPSKPGALTRGELGELIEGSEESVGLEADERDLLKRVISYRRLFVRDVMTRRQSLAAVPRECSRAMVIATARKHSVSRLPVHDGNLDRIVGVLPIRPYLLDPRGEATPIGAHLQTVKFVPESASIEQLGAFFRSNGCDLAIAVDEYGGTSGIVSVEDAVESVAGDIADPGEQTVDPPVLQSDGSWVVDADAPFVEIADRFGLDSDTSRVATLGGFMLESLRGFAPVGAAVEVNGRRLEIHSLDGDRPGHIRVWPRRQGRVVKDE